MKTDWFDALEKRASLDAEKQWWTDSISDAIIGWGFVLFLAACAVGWV